MRILRHLQKTKAEGFAEQLLRQRSGFFPGSGRRTTVAPNTQDRLSDIDIY
jgi:hypothetical protein